MRTIRGARENAFRAHRARRLKLRRRGRSGRLEGDIPADCAGVGGRSGRANRTAPKKCHTADVNYATDGGGPVCLSAANRPLMRAFGIAHLAPSHFDISG